MSKSRDMHGKKQCAGCKNQKIGTKTAPMHEKVSEIKENNDHAEFKKSKKSCFLFSK